MSKETQIEEMGKLCPFHEEGKCNLLEDKAEECNFDCDMCDFAKTLYNADYRKQNKGEWKVTRTAKRTYIKCTRCNYTKLFDRLESITDDRKYIINDFISEHTFCPNCGAKMKGGAE